MAELNFTNETQEKYFQFDVDTEVPIILQTKRALRDLQRKAAKRAKLTGEDVADVADKMLGRQVVKKSWRKISDHNHPGLTVKGKPLEFTLENLDNLMTGNIKFSKFVNEKCVDEDEFIEEPAEAKND
jgi:hypothetical protein